jgi:outer membrane protein assembly factor BamB/tetratricopeptide (TPR) repeat protein
MLSGFTHFYGKAGQILALMLVSVPGLLINGPAAVVAAQNESRPVGELPQRPLPARIVVEGNARPEMLILQAGGVRIVGGLRGGVENRGLRKQADSTDNDLGAILKTDPDLEASLETAERFRQDGNYRVAIQIWQAVLQRSGDTLYSRDGEIYFSLTQQVERVLASLPPEALATYRITADAEAKEILAQAGDPLDPTALSQIVRFYFLSSLGDEAAFQLGCIYLDNYDFIGARRLFEKILNQYPDPSIDRNQLLIRLALCQSFLGQPNAADELLNQVPRDSGYAKLVDGVRQNLGKLNANPNTSLVDSAWVNYLGNARRYGGMPAPPEDFLRSDLAAVWQFYLSPDDRYNAADSQGNVLAGSKAADSSTRRTVTNREEALIKAWSRNRWRPAGNLLFADGLVYFKGAADMTAWEIPKIEAQLAGRSPAQEINEFVSWRSVWRNGFEIDEATMMTQLMRRSWGGGNLRRDGSSVSGIPESVPEIQFFGDTIYQQISIGNDILYSVEGASFDRQRKAESRRPPQYNASIRRARSNFLTAYDRVSGKLLWTLPRQQASPGEAAATEVGEGDESTFLDAGGFMAAPIQYGNLILVPVNQGGAITIYALDPQQQGKTVWKSFLCDEPAAGAEAQSPIQLSLDGSDLFVSTGMGVIFVIDPSNGMVRFARRYPRSGKPDEFHRRNFQMASRLAFDGWSSDVIIPYGRQMICFCSDADSIFAYDRNSGNLIWRTEMNPVGYKVDYLLGIFEDVLYAAGRETIIAYDLLGEGRMIWGAEQLFDGKQSKGRGMLTPEGIFIPVERSIYQFALPGKSAGSEAVRKVAVDFGTATPVGNLYSDGKRIWVHGGNRVSALAPLD